MKHRIRFVLGALCAFVSVAMAADGIGSPALGVVHDARCSCLRTLVGIVGAAQVGDAIPVSFDVKKAWFDGRSTRALVLSDEGVVLELLDVRNSPVTALAVEGAAAHPDLVTLSAKGSYAALYYASGSLLQVVALGTSPHGAWQTTIDGSLGTPVALAVSEKGEAVLSASASPGGVVWHLRNASAGPQQLWRTAGNPSASLVANDRFLLVTDGAGDVVKIDAWATAPIPRILAGSRDGLVRPSSAAASDDGKTVYVADDGTAQIMIYDEQTNAMHGLPVAGQVSGFQRLGDPPVFLLNSLRGDPLLLLDATGTPQISFVPAPITPARRGRSSRLK